MRQCAFAQSTSVKPALANLQVNVVVLSVFSVVFGWNSITLFIKYERTVSFPNTIKQSPADTLHAALNGHRNIRHICQINRTFEDF